MKKNQVKRILAMTITATLILGSLSGCGKSDRSTTAADYETAAPADAADSGAYAEAAAEEPYWDMNDGNASTVKEEPWAYAESGESDTGVWDEENAAEEGSYAESCYGVWEPEKEERRTAGNTEEYSKWQEKGFSTVLAEPLSTFAADVDTASYSNLWRLVKEGYTLDDIRDTAGAVRIEELLNYFSYDYQEPKAGEPFGVNMQISKCPWNEEASLLMIGLATEKIDYEDAPPSNLVFLLDVSGSMGDRDKLPLLQEAFCLLAENLTEKDRISIVTYSNEDRIVLRGAKGDETKKIQRTINSLEASGGTHGSKGLEAAYELAEEYFIEGGNNRIILATDGDLNIGLTSEEELEEFISEKKESGIFLSVLGFGGGNLKDNKMEILADKGNGNYAYIDSLREAKKVLVEEITATLLTICKDVKLQVEFNPAVVSDYRLIGYHNRELDRKDFHDDTKDGGEIGAGHSVTALYELILREPLSGMGDEEIEELRYSENYKEEMRADGMSSKALEEEWLTLSIRYKNPLEEKSNLLQYPVSYADYVSEPGDDFVFAAAVAEFGLLASDSSYAGSSSLKHVKKTLNGMDLNDEYKEDFLNMVKEIEE